MATQERPMPFIRNLASSDSKTRSAALSSLRSFVSARQTASSLTPVDVLKLWNGLFFALWMCDRPLPQQALCADLADIVFSLPRHRASTAVATWLRGFWATMAREWTGIDVLRMNKFLLLVRRVVGASFRWMRTTPDEDMVSATRQRDQETGWDEERTEMVLGLLEEWPFALEEEARPEHDRKCDQHHEDHDHDHDHDLDNTTQPQDGPLMSHHPPVGLKLHVLDIWVDEADKVGLLDDQDKDAQVHLQRIVKLVETLEQRTISKAVRIRAKDSLADERLPRNRKAEQAEARDVEGDMHVATADGDGESWDGFDD